MSLRDKGSSFTQEGRQGQGQGLLNMPRWLLISDDEDGSNGDSAGTVLAGIRVRQQNESHKCRRTGFSLMKFSTRTPRSISWVLCRLVGIASLERIMPAMPPLLGSNAHFV